MPKQKQKNHIPVLLQEVLEMLAPKQGEKYLDVTAGYGGHAKEILQMTKGRATLIDRDKNAVQELSKIFKSNDVSIIHKDFFTASQEMMEKEKKFDMIFADLGVSSLHLDKASRGFSIHKDAPLDMRMDQRQKLTASELVNTYTERDISRILKYYGNEPKANRIAKLIIENRPISNTTELANIVAKVWPGYSRIHPATRSFQAIRIAVNEELKQLGESLGIWLQLLNAGGRLAVISFHSLEDSIVKNFFRENGGDKYDAELMVLTKRPIQASFKEIVNNPRSRSAKLRVAVKTKIKKRKGN